MENEELLDYEDEEQHEQQIGNKFNAVAKKDVKGTYVSIHSSGFKDFLLKPELLRAIMDCGFEHPSEGNSHTKTQNVTKMRKGKTKKKKHRHKIIIFEFFLKI